MPHTAPIRIAAPVRLAVGGTAVQGTDTGTVHGVIVKAICPSQTVYVGASAAVTTANGYPLADGAELLLEVANGNQLFFIASAAAQAVSILPFTRY